MKTTSVAYLALAAVAHAHPTVPPVATAGHGMGSGHLNVAGCDILSSILLSVVVLPSPLSLSQLTDARCQVSGLLDELRPGSVGSRLA